MREGLSRLWVVPVLVFFCAPLFIGLGNTDLQNDEAIYSFAVDSILETGDWLSPRSSPNSHVVFLEKPPLKFWIVALPIRAGLLPHNEFGLRFWDALFGAIAFLYVCAIGWRLGGWMCAVIAVLALFLQTELLFEHGLRTNNMEAPLVLSYCAGIHHFLVWASTAGVERRRWHAAAVGAYFFLGFMTKFVAALFLPIVLASAVACSRPARSRLYEDWRLWLLVWVCVLAGVAPWFIYQALAHGSNLWDIMVAGHVYVRFTTGVDPSHLQPWAYYFRRLYVGVSHSGFAPFAAAGALLLLVDAIRRRRLETTITLLWFVIPIALMSLGSSKLYHYAYPILPPVALAAGYAPARMVGWLTNALQRKRLEELFAMMLRPRWRSLIGAAAIVALCIAIWTALAGAIRLELGPVLFRNSSVQRPLLIAIAAGIIAARGTIVLRAALIVLVFTLLPFQQYTRAVERLPRERHPLRTASDCLAKVASTLRQQRQVSQDVYAIFPESHFWHPYFYYMRRVGTWQAIDQQPPDAVLASRLHDPSAQRPMLVADEWYRDYRRRAKDTHSAPMISFGNVLLIMPGPYAICSPEGVAGAS